VTIFTEAAGYATRPERQLGVDVSDAESFRPVASGGRLTLCRVPDCAS
jgi:hypothetical protein